MLYLVCRGQGPNKWQVEPALPFLYNPDASSGKEELLSFNRYVALDTAEATACSTELIIFRIFALGLCILYAAFCAEL